MEYRFSEFIQKLMYSLEHELPGEEAQYLMAPEFRKEHETLLRESPDPRLGAVLALIYPKENTPHIVLIQRPEYTGVHSGQISLPGGKFEEGDKSLQNTAIRETEEEIGIPANEIFLIGEMTHLYIPASKFKVFPFVGFMERLPEFQPDPREVTSVIEIPIHYLLDRKIVREKEIRLHNQTVVRSPYYAIRDFVVWGATAMILSELTELCRFDRGLTG